MRATLIHLAISAFLALSLGLWVLLVWYPGTYREISGGLPLLGMLLAIDVVLGPLLTLVIYRSSKSRKELLLDFSVIGLLQLGALLYGVWTVYQARPVHLVFEYNRFAVVHAADIPKEDLALAPVHLQHLPITGPSLISLRPLRSEEAVESTMAALAGQAQAAQPQLWQDYELAKPEILQASRPIEDLLIRFPDRKEAIDKAIKKSELPAAQLRYVPLLSRQIAWTTLINAQTGMPVGFLPLDSFD